MDAAAVALRQVVVSLLRVSFVTQFKLKELLKMNRQQHPAALGSSVHNARLAASKALGSKTGACGSTTKLPAIKEEGYPAVEKETPAPEQKTAPTAEAEDDSPLSKFKDWQAVKALAGKASIPTAAPPLQYDRQRQKQELATKPADHIQSATAVATDVSLLVQTLVAYTAVAENGANRARASSTQAVAGGSSLADCLQAISDPAVLAIATDPVLAELLHGLHPLLRFCAATHRWAVTGVADILKLLQLACQERLCRTSLPCDAGLAIAAARFFTHVIREAGGSPVQDDLLAAVAAYARGNCSVLSGEALASLLALLVAARFRPGAPVPFGNACVERLLRLSQGKPGLRLCHFADSVEALAQLRCCDALSAAAVVTLAGGVARELEGDARQLDVAQLLQLARVMQSVAVIATITTVQSGTLLAATAAWHLLVVRASALAQQDAGAGPALGHMWCTSRILTAAAQAQVQAQEAPSFQLPDRLGLMSQAAYLEQEQRVMSGFSSAQRRVLSALSVLKVSPSTVTVNSDFLDVFSISIAVRMCLQTSKEKRQVAILLRDPLKHLLRNSTRGEALGAEVAQERILQSAGWTVCALDTHSCLQLPVSILANELAALMLGESERSNLRFVA